MATQTTEISVELVGRAFVDQFYNVLHRAPEHVNDFFKEGSTMSRPGSSGYLLTVTTMNGIKDHILSCLDYTKYTLEIVTADTQASYMGGVTVLVIGCLTGQDNIRRKFTESFFLAPQESGFFVHNDVFRFINEDSSPVADTVETRDKLPLVDTVTVAAPVQETVQDDESSLVILTAAPKETLVTTTEPVDQQKIETTTEPVVQQTPAIIEKALPQTIVNSNPSVQPVLEASLNRNEDAPKKSYASLLMNGKQGASTTYPVHVRATPAKPVITTSAPKSAPPSGEQTQASIASQVAAANQNASKPSVANENASKSSVANQNTSKTSTVNQNAFSNGNASSNGHVAGMGHSVYIGHLPHDATAELVEREFKRFGSIRKNGIQVRRNDGYVFGFVEYEDASAQENAVKTGTIQIDGKKVFIEEKKTVARGDDYPSRRGGYRNDGFRRGNYSNGRGHQRNNYGNRRNEEGYSCGSQNGNGHDNQNGGGRGGQQGTANK